MPFVTSVDGTRIHYEEWGDRDGEPVLFIHGLGADAIGWFLQRRAFSTYRCIALDNRGSGRSDKPDGPYVLEHMAHDAREVLADAGVERAHVIGASMGGAIAQYLAVLHPDQVRSLTLACTSCLLRDWRDELLAEWADTVEREGMRGFATRNLGWLFGPRSFRRLYPVAVAIGPFLMRAPDHGFVAQIAALRTVDPDVAELIREIRVPTLVLTGSQDILTPVADAEEIASRIPGAELVVIRGAAHGFMVENFRDFNHVVGEFVARHSGENADVIPLRRRATA